MVDVALRYRYEVTRNGQFIGNLPVTSKFGYSQNINTAGAQLVMTVSQSPDIAPLPPEPILDDENNIITDEDNDIITADQALELVALASSDDTRIMLRNGNRLTVYEYSSYHPNGIVVFAGKITKWRGKFGSDDDITVTALNDGMDLGAYLIPGAAANIVDQQQANQDNYGTLFNDGSNFWEIGQTFTTGAGVKNLSVIRLKTRLTGTVPQVATVKLFRSRADAVAGAAPLFSTDVNITWTGTLLDTDFYAPVPVPVNENTMYFLTAGATGTGFGAEGVDFGLYDNVSSYTRGGEYLRTNGWNWDRFEAATGQQMYFKTYYNLLTTSYPFSNTEVTSILNTIMAAYKSYGGRVNLEAYSNTGNLVNYTFKINTILQGIQKLSELAPADWYWYVDVATNTLHFRQASTTADHTLIKGKHLGTIEFEASIEDIKNVIYGTGGDDGSGLGTTVFVKYTDTQSIVDNDGPGIGFLNDNRVQGVDGASTMLQLAQNYAEANGYESYVGVMVVPRAVYDISTFKQGQMIAPRGFGTFMDSMLLQIASINYAPELAILTVGTLPKRDDIRVTEIERQLSDIQTIDNPDAPS